MTRLALPALAALALLALLAPAAAQVELTDPSCRTNGSFNDGTPSPTVPNGHVAWPADAPLWEFDLYRPANRTTVNSGGLEIRNVTFRGRKVLERAHVPVLNVEYDEGGCGCFRDWQTNEAFMEVGVGAVRTLPCLAQSGPGQVETACEANETASDPGGDVGDFKGVSIEDYGDELVLTTHTSAAWYRYRMKWHFYADGRIWPEFSFSAADAVCTDVGHRHHAYWRLDFDLEGTPTDDVVTERSQTGESVVRTERSVVFAGPADDTVYRVTDGATGIGYELRRGSADRILPVDPYSKTDLLVLRYKLDELDDGQTINTGGCAFAFEPFVDGESVEGEDTVLWYRAGALHGAGNPYECDIVGPMLHPIGFSVATPPGTVEPVFEPARPNPFTGSTSLRFRVDTAQAVTAELYDLAGRRVAVLFEGAVAADRWQPVRVDGRTLPAGTYVVRVRGETVRGTTRVVLVR